MRKIYVLLIFCLLLTYCKSKQNIASETPYQLGKYEYPFLGQVLNSYYSTYYKYPNNLDDLIFFIEENNCYIGYMNFMNTYLKLKKNKNNIKIRNEEDHYILIENDSVEIINQTKNDICKDLNNGRLISHWINDILLFKDQKLVYYEGMDTDIERLRKKLMFYRKKGEVKYYHDYDWELLTYAHDKLTFGCGVIDTLNATLPIQRVKDTLAAFANAKQIDSMILAIPMVPLQKIKE